MKFKIIIIMILVSNILFSQNNVNQYLEIAGKNNPVLKSKFNEYLASLEKVKQVGVLPDPKLLFGYFVLPIDTKNGSQLAKFSFTQMFPWFGTLPLQQDVVVNVAKSKFENFQDVKSKLYFNVKSTYYKLYVMKKSVDISLENIKILETFKSIAIRKIRAGKASGVDELRIEMQLADLENQLSLFKDKVKVNVVKFNKLLNTDANNYIDIPDSIVNEDILYSKQNIMDSLKERNHQLHSLDFISQSYLSKQELSKKVRFPKISLGADYISIADNSLSANSGNDGLFVKVGLTIPLHRKKYSAMVNEYQIMQQSINDKISGKTNELETLVEKVYSEYLDANRRIDLFNKQTLLAKNAMSILQSQYTSNGKNFEEILRMEKRLLEYSIKLEKAKADKKIAIAFVNYIIGQN